MTTTVEYDEFSEGDRRSGGARDLCADPFDQRSTRASDAFFDRITTGPEDEPITRAEAKVIAKQEVADFERVILAQINEALGELEDLINRRTGGYSRGREVEPPPPFFQLLPQISQGREHGDTAQEMRAKLNDI